jgi:fructosamine-3-kinase
MDFLETGSRRSTFWEDFGRALAQLHRKSQESFGLEHDNYIGSLPQSNKTHASWSEFFIQERLEAQLKRARDRNKIGGDILLRMEKLFHRLEGLFPFEPPALLHGDLWSGNFFCGVDGEACIFDPAVYFGHREMDIGMSKLFGGFDPAFYQAYNAEWPLGDDWENRVDIANLYPLLVHVNLFGGGYLSQVRSILQRFT